MDRPPRLGLAGSVAVVVSVSVVFTAAVAAVVGARFAVPWVVFATAAAAGLGAGLWLLAGGLSSAGRTLQALTDGIRGFRDQDFSLRLAVTRRDELGDLVALYNQMGDALREERHDLYQRELLLDTVLQGAPAAIFLTGPTGRVAYANRAARDLLAGGQRMEGRAVAELFAAASREMREALLGTGDALFTTGPDGDEETYRTVRRVFHLNTQRHVLHMVERLTPELRRREVEVWKKVIRVMNHELNNSLAPIRSLAHSARQVKDRPEHAHRLEEIFATIEERTEHLTTFLEGYARFARLPRPRPERVTWPEFFEGVQRLSPLKVVGALPAAPGWFDAAQLQQVMINLLKNALEAGSPSEEITAAVHVTADGTVAVEVADRGKGMDAETMSRALLPFYSSKPSGTGLGLALSREIVEAHGGGLRLQSREGGGTVVTFWLPGRAADAC